MTKVCICGIGGHMGANVYSLVSQETDAEVVCGVDLYAPETIKVPVYSAFKDIKEDVDVVIDFSSPAVLASELAWATEKKVPLVLATTGYTADDLKAIDDAAGKTAVFRTANFSLGINLLVKLVKEAAEVLGESFDVEIIEKHHNQKKDAPSGTALMLADSINELYDGKKEYMNGREGQVGKRGSEIGIHAVRGGTIVGEHEVMFAGEDEIITLSHSARSKRVFAAGAVKAALWMPGKPAGKYNMNDLLKDVL